MFKGILGLLAVLLSSTGAQAHSLVLLSESGGMYGKTFNAAVENFGTDLIANMVGAKYRKIYTWHQYGEKQGSMSDWLRQIVREQRSGEKLDVFGLQHTSSTIFSNISLEEIGAIVPYGMIRNLYSTGCSNWGGISLLMRMPAIFGFLPVVLASA